ncbi:ABC transporter ATP-binding protein [Leifsonia sp. NPDC014704]|uniref:ABC transporter ATP-binding protein n=1 Tax=Leifsonia sp. NPDC014704 TaxID=3364123 RepID=UPI0036F463D9
MSSALALLGVSKSFGGAQVLHDVELRLEAGSVHALVGENGAGKSTALKIMAGLERPTAGTVAVGAEPVAFAGRQAAIERGIGLVAQQLSLIPELTLAENLILGQPERIARRGRAARLLREAADQAGLAVRPDVRVRELGLAQRQLGELAIALAQGARILLLDEPTSALGPFETAALFDRVRALARSGYSVLLITHRLDEVRQVADDVTVLSHGRVTLAARVSEVTDDELVRAMVGSVPAVPRRVHDLAGETRLRLEGVSAQGAGARIDGIDLDVRGGEIVGVLGVAGNGQTALAEAAAGVLTLASGAVLVDGAPVGGRPEKAAETGLAYVPEAREQAVLPDAPLTRSAVLRTLGSGRRFLRHGLIDWKAARSFTSALLERHDVRPADPDLPARALSGGNQQKLLVGRELDGSPAVAVLHGPTQGLDLHAGAVIRGEIRSAAAAGAAILLVSADTDEIRELADTILILSKGRIVDRFEADEFDSTRVGRAMAGLTGAAADGVRDE